MLDVGAFLKNKCENCKHQLFLENVKIPTMNKFMFSITAMVMCDEVAHDPLPSLLGTTTITTKNIHIKSSVVPYLQNPIKCHENILANTLFTLVNIRFFGAKKKVKMGFFSEQNKAEFEL